MQLLFFRKKSFSHFSFQQNNGIELATPLDQLLTVLYPTEIALVLYPVGLQKYLKVIRNLAQNLMKNIPSYGKDSYNSHIDIKFLLYQYIASVRRKCSDD